MSELTDQQIFDRLGAIKGAPTCSQWADGFADSIREQITKGRRLSDRQKVVCHKILKENSEEAQKSLANWEAEYNESHKQEANQLATYYKQQTGGYFGALVASILADQVPHGVSISKCVTISSQRRFLLRLSASLVSAQKTTSFQTPSFRLDMRSSIL